VEKSDPEVKELSVLSETESVEELLLLSHSGVGVDALINSVMFRNLLHLENWSAWINKREASNCFSLKLVANDSSM